ncbi:MAG: hypothetical protein C0625_01225 [Arcobacter sp.]|nr:MAG: hypothetical protein C0625_01225 [Arcobacter sp.]
MLRHKSLFLFFLFFQNLHSFEVIKTNVNINYKEIINIKKLSSANVLSVKKFCIPIRIKDLENKKYVAKRYLKKGTVLCTKDIESYEKKSVLFDFGVIEIEKQGKIIFENDEYIRIKRVDGTIEKIYKDGRLQ